MLLQKSCPVLIADCSTVMNHIQFCGCCCDVAASGRSACEAVRQTVKESGNHENHCQTVSAASPSLFLQNEELTFYIYFSFLFPLSITWRRA